MEKFQVTNRTTGKIVVMTKAEYRNLLQITGGGGFSIIPVPEKKPAKIPIEVKKKLDEQNVKLIDI